MLPRHPPRALCSLTCTQSRPQPVGHAALPVVSTRHAARSRIPRSPCGRPHPPCHEPSTTGLKYLVQIQRSSVGKVRVRSRRRAPSVSREHTASYTPEEEQAGGLPGVGGDPARWSRGWTDAGVRPVARTHHELRTRSPIDLGCRSESASTPWRVPTRSRPVPRKEVIQPQLPLRLPCYDFVPVARPTLGACLSCELARRLQVLPTPMT